MKIDVHCSEEDKIVGHLEIGDVGTTKLTTSVLQQNFYPKSEEYVLKNIHRDKLLRCARCGNPLEMYGNVKTDESSEEIERILTVIIVGRTQIRVR